MKTHALRIWPKHFAPILTYDCKFQYRRNDRSFEVGDIILFREWDPKTKQFTDREELQQRITYVLDDNDIGIPKGFCVFGIEDID